VNINPSTVNLTRFPDEALILIMEQLKTSSPRVLISLRQHTMLQQKMMKQTDGSWKRRETFVPVIR
jgi:hypothetical protein